MKCAALLLMAIVIPATLGGQEVRIEGARHNLPATTSPDGCWTVTPLYHNGKFVSYEWTEKVDPPVPPQPPAPPKPPPAPVPPVVPTPQCQVVYYIEPTPYAPVSGPSWQYGHTVRGGCGLLRRIFGRCR